MRSESTTPGPSPPVGGVSRPRPHRRTLAVLVEPTRRHPRPKQTGPADHGRPPSLRRGTRQRDELLVAFGVGAAVVWAALARVGPNGRVWGGFVGSVAHACVFVAFRRLSGHGSERGVAAEGALIGEAAGDDGRGAAARRAAVQLGAELRLEPCLGSGVGRLVGAVASAADRPAPHRRAVLVDVAGQVARGKGWQVFAVRAAGGCVAHDGRRGKRDKHKRKRSEVSELHAASPMQR